MGRQLLDIIVFLTLHMGAAFVVFWAGWVFLSRWTGLRARVKSTSPTAWRRGTVVLSLGALSLLAAIGVWYLVLDGFSSEVEPLVSSLSWLVQNGKPLYHDLDSAQRYSVLYGPAVFLTNGLFLRILGPGLVAAKAASLLGLLGSLVFLYASLARRGRDVTALAAAGLAAVYFLSQGLAVYLVRPDALLIFSVGLGLYAAVKVRRLLAMITLAVAIGFAVNLKVHAGVYFLPVLPLLARRFGWRSVLPVLVGAAGVAATPFVFHPQVSLANYVGWLRNAMHHGLVLDTVFATLQYTVYLVLPLAVLLAISPVRGRQVRRHAPVFICLGIALVLTLVLAMKPGAGLVHLLPLVPSTLYLTGLILGEVLALKAWSPIATGYGLRQGAVAAVLLTALMTGTVTSYRAVRYCGWRLDRTPDLAADVEGVLARFPDLPIAMGCGGENGFTPATWLRPLLVFADNPVLVDHISMMDFQLGGLDLPPETYQALEDGVVKMWLVPRGEQPFRICNGYAPGESVFPAPFVRQFASLYSLRGHSRYFDLWVWDGLDKCLNSPGQLAVGSPLFGALLAP